MQLQQQIRWQARSGSSSALTCSACTSMPSSTRKTSTTSAADFPSYQERRHRFSRWRRFCLGACLSQAGRQAYLRVENLGDRAAFLRLIGDLLELRFIDAGNLRLELERDGGNAEAFAVLVQCDLGSGGDTVGGKAGLAEHQRQGHGEAAGMGSADQFLGVGAGCAFEAGVKAVWIVLQGTAFGADGSLAAFQVALPDGGCGFLHEPSGCWIGNCSKCNRRAGYAAALVLGGQNRACKLQVAGLKIRLLAAQLLQHGF